MKCHADNWLCRDTIRSYSILEGRMGCAVTIHAGDKGFMAALQDELLAHCFGIQISVLKTNGSAVSPETSEEIANGYLLSDTIILMNNAKIADAALALCGYVYCPFGKVFSMANMTISYIFLGFAMFFSAFDVVERRKTKGACLSLSAMDENMVAFGDLILCNGDNCMYNMHHSRVNLTPLEYSLMEMFYNTSSHLLFKRNTCDALWPGKDNANESLYTLVSRLKRALVECRNVRISAVRGVGC